MSIHRKARNLLFKGGFRPWAIALPFVSAHLATGAPGDLDTGFGTSGNIPILPVSSGTVINSAVPQQDGTILIGGVFSQIHSNSRLYAARLNANGSLNGYTVKLVSSAPFNNTVTGFNSQIDGGAYVTGAFSYQLSSAVRAGSVKLARDGNIDSGYVPRVNLVTNTLVEQGPGGSLLLGTVSGLFRSQRTGVKDTSFTDYAQGPVVTLQVQPNLKILMGGGFPGTTLDTPYYDRRKLDGKVDEDINPNNNQVTDNFRNPAFNGQVRAMALQPDGKILIAGDFSVATIPIEDPPYLENVERAGIARLNADGTLDMNFHAFIGYESPSQAAKGHALALQADGKIIVGGEFTQVKTTVGNVSTPHTRRGIARFNSDGTADTSFDAKFKADAYFVNGLSLQADGKILVTGQFFPPSGSGVFPWRIARLLNDSAINYLRTPVHSVQGTTVQWIRGGSAPETSSVYFEYSLDNQNWIPMGATGNGLLIEGTRSWTIDSTPLANNYYLRASARTAGGLYNGSTALPAVTARFPIPEITVTTSLGIPLPKASTFGLAYVGTGEAQDITLTVKNSGTGNLTGLVPALSGTNASLFTVITAPTSPLAGPGGTSQLVLRFNPTSTGAKTALLTIPSNDANTPSYTITFTATVVPPIEAFRQKYFLTSSNTGNAADSADPDGDGHTNFFEFVAGLVPTSRTSRFQQRVDHSSGTPKVIFSPIVAGRTYEVQTSTTLGNDWIPAAGGSESDNGTERTYTHTGVTDPKRFYRIKITK